LNRAIAIHGHFYQPPRENPWLESVEVQDSAAPYHDWNERVTAECYAPNTAARRVDEHPPLAVRYKTEPATYGVEQLHHPGRGRSLPAAFRQRPFKVLARG